MGTTTITDFADLRWSAAELHAWALGDVAALEGVRRIANPYTKPEETHLRDCWDQGHCGWPLAKDGAVA